MSQFTADTAPEMARRSVAVRRARRDAGVVAIGSGLVAVAVRGGGLLVTRDKPLDELAAEVAAHEAALDRAAAGDWSELNAGWVVGPRIVAAPRPTADGEAEVAAPC